ncbi:MAG: hypothetical protein RLZZ111_2056 [Planctomycetota bacterium]|jgi:hypothetical protein
MTSPERPVEDSPAQQAAAEAVAREDVPPQPRRRGFLSTQARAALASAAVAALLGLASIPWLLSSPERLTGLVAKAAPRLEADVRFDAVAVRWLGPTVLEGVRIVPRDGSRTPITIRRIEASHGLAGILLSLGDLGRVRVEGLDAQVAFDAERNSNLRSLVAAVGDEAAAGVAPGSRSPRKSPLRMRLEVADALVTITGPWTPDPWVSDPINVRATLAPTADGRASEWTIHPVQLLADARLEPAVAQSVLAYIAPIMADATRSGGRFSLRLNSARLPVGGAPGGHIDGVLSMHAVDLGPGPLVMRIIDSLPFQLPQPPVIRIADQSHVEFHVAERRVWHKGLAFGVPLPKIGDRLDLESSGSVGLDDKLLDLKLELPIPANMPQDRPLLASLAGRTFSVRVGGVLGEPRVNFDGSIRATAGQVVSELVSRLRGGPVMPRRAEGSAPIEPPAVPAPTAAAPSATGNPGPTGAPKPQWRPPPAPGAGNGAQPEKQAERQAGPRGGAGDRRDTGATAGSSDATADDAADTADRIKSALPADLKADPTADAVIDLVGGVLENVARRRAERQAAEAANPQQAPPPRRGRLLRRLMQPEPLQPAPLQPAAPAAQPPSAASGPAAVPPVVPIPTPAPAAGQ